MEIQSRPTRLFWPLVYIGITGWVCLGLVLTITVFKESVTSRMEWFSTRQTFENALVQNNTNMQTVVTRLEQIVGVIQQLHQEEKNADARLRVLEEKAVIPSSPKSTFLEQSLQQSK